MLWKQKEQSPLFTPKTRTGNEGKRGFLKGRSRAQNPFLDMLRFSRQTLAETKQKSENSLQFSKNREKLEEGREKIES